MAFDKMIVKKLLKKFDDVPFVVKFPDGEEFKVGEGEPQAIIRANGGIWCLQNWKISQAISAA